MKKMKGGMKCAITNTKGKSPYEMGGKANMKAAKKAAKGK
jgi:hypothetical protein